MRNLNKKNFTAPIIFLVTLLHRLPLLLLRRVITPFPGQLTINQREKSGQDVLQQNNHLYFTGKTSVPLEVARKRAVSSKSPSDTILSRTLHFPYSRTFFPKVGQALGIVVLLFILSLSGSYWFYNHGSIFSALPKGLEKVARVR